MATDKRAPDKFGNVAIALHWAMALLIVISVASGLVTVNTNDADLTRSSLVLHQSFGLIIFALVVARITWRLTHPAPTLPAGLPPGQTWAATLTHVTLYLLMVAIPLTGYTGLAARGRAISVFGLFDLPQAEFRDIELSRLAQTLHTNVQYALYAIVAVHILAALYHQFIIRDGLIRRMWFGPLKHDTSSAE